jgi:hypothetical protein
MLFQGRKTIGKKFGKECATETVGNFIKGSNLFIRNYVPDSLARCSL